ncbi:hypothetical protein NQ318_008984 [Aromia moschata]|uniref:Uncharacterized protein n=1 Tax=Aromia moschata TaxID=1265417 RepID=A0AAV8ZD78_9CUCU|nr:hypothetical protein NQ318_008984 [Aromia moschata]
MRLLLRNNKTIYFQSKSPGCAIFCISFIAALFWICYAGQRILDEIRQILLSAEATILCPLLMVCLFQTSSVGDAIYDSKWYEADPKLAQYVILIIRRSQRPATLRALPLGSLDFPMFAMVRFYKIFHRLCGIDEICLHLFHSSLTKYINE